METMTNAQFALETARRVATETGQNDADEIVKDAEKFVGFLKAQEG